MDNLRFEDLRAVNVRRCEDVFHPLFSWTETDWACALAGEIGELCNLIKKRRRLNPGVGEASKFIEFGVYGTAAIDEMADVVIYLDLLAARMGVDLGAAIRKKFNEVSCRRGSAVLLPEATDGRDDQE